MGVWGVCLWGVSASRVDLPPGGSASRGWGLHLEGVCILGGSASGESASRGSGVCIQGWGGLHPGGLGRPPWDTTGYGQKAGGTHPTGMHSSLCLAKTNTWIICHR